MAGTAITVAPEFVEETVYRAAPGQVGGMETGDAPLGAVLDKAFSRSAFLRSAVWGQLVWSGRLEAGGTAGSPSIKVGPIDAVCLRAAETRSGNSVDVWRAFLEPAETTLGISHVEGAPGSLTSDTWYYVYVYSNGTTTLQWQITTTPPTDSGAPTVLRQWKRGASANYRYLGCFRTDNSGKPLPVYATRGRVLYQRSAVSGAYGSLASGGLRARDATGSASLTALSLASRVPPHSRVALVRGTITMGPSTPAADASAELRLYTGADTTIAVAVRAMTSAATNATAQGDAELVTTASQAIGFSVDLVDATASHAIDCMGWVE
ncbi:MAG: hypothetical protein U0324_29120 [Polyangiales bacterium]